jgi:hypothetical protein
MVMTGSAVLHWMWCKFSFLEDLELTCKPKDCTGFFNSLESQQLPLDDKVVSHAMEQKLGRFL